MNSYQLGKYMDVLEITLPNRKTHTYQLKSKQGDSLGEVKWNPGWRKFCFYPVNDTVFDDKCLVDLIEFIQKLNLIHKEEKNEN